MQNPNADADADIVTVTDIVRDDSVLGGPGYSTKRLTENFDPCACLLLLLPELGNNTMAAQSKSASISPWGKAVAGASGAVLANALVYPLDM